MKDFFKIGLADKDGNPLEGRGKHYVKNAGWWITHRPVQWFFWLGFFLYLIPVTIENSYWTWKQGKRDKNDQSHNE